MADLHRFGRSYTCFVEAINMVSDQIRSYSSHICLGFYFLWANSAYIQYK
jgi:hypothetical protein